jgi:hypothetical protein
LPAKEDTEPIVDEGNDLLGASQTTSARMEAWWKDTARKRRAFLHPQEVKMDTEEYLKQARRRNLHDEPQKTT